jgi:signal transduction histidine kinase/CheY-like chemotaxis protein
MHASLSGGVLQPIDLANAPAAGSAANHLGWRTLPSLAQAYVAAVIASGAVALVAFFPFTYPQPALFALLLITTCLTSAWKVNLPISLTSSSTLSVSCAANLMALLLLGPRHAVIIAVAGAWTQCTYQVKEPYPLHRTVFSAAAEAITMVAAGLAYGWFGGTQGPFDLTSVAKPLVGSIATYFFVNTGLVAGAIALSTGRRFVRVWRDDFLWSGASFMVAGSAGALAATIVHRGEQWKAALMLAPIYLTYRTYELFVGRLEDHKQHVLETRKLHEQTVGALLQAREAERALADEKHRLAAALADMTRLVEGRKELLAREHAARASAEEANRLKDQFLAIVSHELRTPLNAIRGRSEMLRSGRLDLARRDRANQVIYASATRQAGLIEELLDVARIMSGKLRLERTAIDVADVVRGALQVVQPLAEAKQIHIGLDADPSPYGVHGDGARLQQVAWNLLSNAIKFTPDRGVVQVRLCRTDDEVEIVVSDSGQGIPRAFLPSVFKPFCQADGSTTRLHGGLGLGLSIVKHLIEAHGGTVRADSGGEGRGAAFTVRLPRIACPDRTVTATDHDSSTSLWEREHSTALLKGLSVLVVDDDAECRQVTAAHLESEQAEVLTAASAAQALDLLKRAHVDVLLADIAMPGEDGYSLIRKLRALGPSIGSIPAAALTSCARDEDRQQALRAGFQLHLAKPIEGHSLIAAVASLHKSPPTS